MLSRQSLGSVANHRTQKGVQLIDIPVSLHPHIIFRNAFTAEQAGSSSIAAAGVYFHGTFSLLSCQMDINRGERGQAALSSLR